MISRTNYDFGRKKKKQRRSLDVMMRGTPILPVACLSLFVVRSPTFLARDAGRRRINPSVTIASSLNHRCRRHPFRR